jgi:hypothetical protein
MDRLRLGEGEGSIGLDQQMVIGWREIDCGRTETIPLFGFLHPQ